MDSDDLEPRARKVVPVPLETLSVEAIGDYIAELKAEIARAEAAITTKQAARAAADSFFKR